MLDADQDPKYTDLFSEIGDYITTLRDGAQEDSPSSKKRKLETPSDVSTPLPTPIPSADGAALKVSGISFTVPQRKKFELVFTGKSVSAVGATSQVEFGVDYDNIGISAICSGVSGDLE